MDRKKKKQAANKSAAAIALAQKDLKKRFLDRTKEFVTLSAGVETLEKISPVFFNLLYELRYPGLKIKAAPNTAIPKARVVQFNKMVQQMMDSVELTLPNGSQIPMKWYLSEGQTFIDAVDEIDILEKPELADIKARFSDFDADGKFYQELRYLLVDVMSDACTMLNDYNDHLYRADLAMTPYFARFNPQNDVFIHIFKPEQQQVPTAQGLRRAISLGRMNDDHQWEEIKVKPSALGFPVKGLDIPLTLYMTNHALNRLQERINITPGIMHSILFTTFFMDKIPHRFTRTESQVEFSISDQKAGYLVVKLHGTKLVIHTFLFLTNNGTVEGEKLERLLKIEKADKKYLEIDTLPSFNAYHVDQNPALSKLFIDAGCGSLLNLRHLEAFTINAVKDKDPESIMRYLADAPYFKWRKGSKNNPDDTDHGGKTSI